MLEHRVAIGWPERGIAKHLAEDTTGLGIGRKDWHAAVRNGVAGANTNLSNRAKRNKQIDRTSPVTREITAPCAYFPRGKPFSYTTAIEHSGFTWEMGLIPGISDKDP